MVYDVNCPNLFFESGNQAFVFLYLLIIFALILFLFSCNKCRLPLVFFTTILNNKSNKRTRIVCTVMNVEIIGDLSGIGQEEECPYPSFEI